MYNQYIENITLIDYTVLNFYDLEYMFAQTRNIIKTTYPSRSLKYPPVFMVCAAPSSGKATLMEIVGDLGEINSNITITHKYAKRAPRDSTDGRDGMIAIGKEGDFVNYIESPDKIWDWQFHEDTASYTFDRDEIYRNVHGGRPQIYDCFYSKYLLVLVNIVVNR